MRFLAAIVSTVFLVACAAPAEQPDNKQTTRSSAAAGKTDKSKPDKNAEPVPRTIQIKLDDPNGRARTETRPLFNISVAKNLLELNGQTVKDLDAVRAVLARHNGLVITVAAHRCLESERAAEVLSLAQQYTTVPVTYGSFGDFGDAHCE